MVQIDMEMPKTCRECRISHIEEDMNCNYYYDCGLIDDTIRGKQKDKRHKDCPLNEVDVTPAIKELNYLKTKLRELQKINSKQVKDCPEESNYYLGKVNAYYVTIKMIDRQILKLKEKHNGV